MQFHQPIFLGLKMPYCVYLFSLCGSDIEVYSVEGHSSEDNAQPCDDPRQLVVVETPTHIEVGLPWNKLSTFVVIGFQDAVQFGKVTFLVV